MGVQKKNWELDLRQWLQTLAIIFGALSAVYQFYFKEILSPAKEPAALDLSVKLEKVGEKGGMVYVKAIVVAQNKTHRRIYVPAFWFTAYGSRFGSSRALETKELVAFLNNSGDSLVNRYRPKLESEVVSQRRIVFDSVNWWEPGDKTNDEAILVVPKGKFDYLEVRALYMHSRDGSVLDTAKWSLRDDGAWDAQLQLKTSSGAKPSLFDYSNADHRDWAERTGTGFNWYVTTLPI